MNKTNRITILTILFSTKLFADLASPTPFIVKQPNGLELSILIEVIIFRAGMSIMDGLY